MLAALAGDWAGADAVLHAVGGDGGLAAALATPARGPRQHCQSCTCNGKAAAAATPMSTMATADLDYVRMETPKLRQKRRKSLSEIVTDPFLA